MSNANSQNKKLKTDFATARLDDEGIIHIKVKEGVDITKENLKLLFEWMSSLNLKKFIVLADRSQSYSHNFEAQKFFMQTRQITALAMYVTTPISKELALLSKDVYLKNFPVKVFTDKKEATTWLKTFL